jgi:hypothetical protein
MPFPYTFAALTGPIALANLDANFTAAALASDLTLTNAAIAALPSDTTPLKPVAGGADGASAELSRDDHQHPPQSALPTINTGNVTVMSTMDGSVQEHNNTTAATYTFDNSITAGCSGLITQINTGQITFAAGSGAAIRQADSFTKSRARWSVVSWYCRANTGSAAEIVLSGDMAA